MDMIGRAVDSCERFKPEPGPFPDPMAPVVERIIIWLQASGVSMDRSVRVERTWTEANPNWVTTPIFMTRSPQDSLDYVSVLVRSPDKAISEWWHLHVDTSRDSPIELASMREGTDLLRVDPMENGSPTYVRMCKLYQMLRARSFTEGRITELTASCSGFCSIKSLVAALRYLDNRGAYVSLGVADGVATYIWQSAFRASREAFYEAQLVSSPGLAPDYARLNEAVVSFRRAIKAKALELGIPVSRLMDSLQFPNDP